MKPDVALLKEGDFYYPNFTNDLHFECEIVVKIDKVGKNIEEKFASKYYSEVTLGIDFTARDLQSQCKEKGLPWEKINFDHLGYCIDANTRMSRSKSKIPKIILHIILNPKEEPILYSKLYYRLIDILTHETNHLDQLGMNRTPFNSHVSDKMERNNAKKSYKYFLLKDEIESMTEGMYASAKAQNIPLDQVFDNYLLPLIQSGYISDQEYNKVIRVWVTRSLELYPDATFSTKVDHIVNSI
jgi:hypothetical protein